MTCDIEHAEIPHKGYYSTIHASSGKTTFMQISQYYALNWREYLYKWCSLGKNNLSLSTLSKTRRKHATGAYSLGCQRLVYKPVKHIATHLCLLEMCHNAIGVIMTACSLKNNTYCMHV